MFSKKIISTSNNDIQAMKKQFGLQDYVAGTIHYAMGDTLLSFTTSFSMSDSNSSI